ncbi:hypothetical protein IGI04_025536 [Brassica rapa subsp. trilocularis]|uniref:Uncharacterized protein n=1 Tax=Brassica rapa subsp. trilocularis TaxID=1813537 RepID=A0ABQ7KTB6_BRACM|nr:hypothetical protein IGI04_025536 [Brassica rapa subsp. trilocularis]
MIVVMTCGNKNMLPDFVSSSLAKNISGEECLGEKHEAATISGEEQEPLILHRRHHDKRKSELQKYKDDPVKLFFGKRF